MLFLYVRRVFVADITRVVRKKTPAAYSFLRAKKTCYVPYDRVSRVYTSGDRNKRAELIKNFGHARVGSFVVARYVPIRSCAKSQFRLPTRSHLRAANQSVCFARCPSRLSEVAL